MKHLLLLLTLFCAQYIKCQDWCHQGSQWTYEINTAETIGTVKYIFESDTSILSEQCKKIRTISVYKYKFSPDSTLYSSYPAPTFTFSRNDTVFFYNYNKAKFIPTYFFSANLGDTVTYPDFHELCGFDTAIFSVIQERGFVNINGQNLRYYVTRAVNYTSSIFYPDTIRVIERIGSLEEMLPLHICVVDGSANYLRCYQDDSFSVYQTNIIVPCDYILSVPSQVYSYKIKIYPNPTSELLFIENDLKIQCTVYNSLGIIVYSYTSEKSSPVNISFLPTGMYYIKVDDSKQIAYTSFIKQ